MIIVLLITIFGLRGAVIDQFSKHDPVSSCRASALPSPRLTARGADHEAYAVLLAAVDDFAQADGEHHNLGALVPCLAQGARAADARCAGQRSDPHTTLAAPPRQLFKYFRFSARVAFLFRTLEIAAVDLLFFVFVFFVFFVGFAHVSAQRSSARTRPSGQSMALAAFAHARVPSRTLTCCAQSAYTAFSNDTGAYRTFWISIITLVRRGPQQSGACPRLPLALMLTAHTPPQLRGLTSDLPYEEMALSNRIYGPLYYIGYQACTPAVLRSCAAS
jgi:hypothetical protein